MKIWTWLLPCELPSEASLDAIVGASPFLIEVYKEVNPTDLINWLCSSCVAPVLFAPMYGNPLETLEPYNIYFVYFADEDDACHFRLRWG